MKNLEKKVFKFLKDRSWHQLKPVDIAKSIAIESSELLEHFQWTNDSLESVKKDKQKVTEIGQELADIFLYCLQMATLLSLNSEKLILQKLKKVSKKYPAKLMREEAKKSYPGSANYWKIKKEHRKIAT